MRRINSNIITEEVKRLCIEGNTILGDDVIKSFEENLTKEESHLGRDILKILITYFFTCSKCIDLTPFAFG